MTATATATATETTGMSARDYQHKRFRARGGDSSSRGRTTDDEHPVLTSIDSMPARIVTPTRSRTSSPAKSTGTSTMGGSEAVIMDGEGRTNDSSADPKQVPSHIQMVEMEDNDKSSIAPVTSEGSEDSNSISNQMKRMVQTNYAQPPKSPEHMLHTATATGTGDLSSSPFRTEEPRRYSLGSSSKKHYHKEEGRRRASDGMAGAPGKTKLQAAHNLALKSTSTGEQKRVSDTQLLSSRSSSSRPDPNAYKIFLLLLQPKSKIFELIQLIYSPNDTTLGDILKMIPDNASEHALGAQEYLGLCRPKGAQELLDKNLLASKPTLAGASGDTKSADITMGEILVAIPQGYSGQDVAALSKQILDNPKIVKLLKRSDPLTRKKRRSSRSHRHSSGTSGSRRSGSRRQLEILNKLDEEEEGNQEQKMKQAMEHATAEANTANAAIRSGSIIKIKRSDSMHSASEKSVGNMSMQESLDESYSSWSKSFDNSFATQSSLCGGVSRRAIRRKERQARRMIVLKRTGAAAFSLMIGVYFLDPRGYAEQIDEVTDNPMGLAGIFQCFFLLLTLYKMERFFCIDDGEQIRRCPFLKASANAMDQLKTRYSNKLKQNPSKIYRNSGEEASIQSSPHRLRNFSLKADRSSDDEQDTTGSL
jgi:hypothetical protein